MIKVADLLEPMRAQCLYKFAGWWIYEFCFGQHIRQFHEVRVSLGPSPLYLIPAFHHRNRTRTSRASSTCSVTTNR